MGQIILVLIFCGALIAYSVTNKRHRVQEMQAQINRDFITYMARSNEAFYKASIDKFSQMEVLQKSILQKGLAKLKKKKAKKD